MVMPKPTNLKHTRESTQSLLKSELEHSSPEEAESICSARRCDIISKCWLASQRQYPGLQYAARAGHLYGWVPVKPQAQGMECEIICCMWSWSNVKMQRKQMFLFKMLPVHVINIHLWQSRVENEHYSVHKIIE